MPEGLIQELEEYFKQLDVLPVHELKKMARSKKGISIHGRQTSRVKGKKE